MAEVLTIAAAAMRNSMATLERVSHNVANASTPAYKRELRVQEHFAGRLARAEQILGHSALDWSAGPLRISGDPASFAIEGRGWFQLRSPAGVVLTRDGSFHVDYQGRLVSSHGWPVVLDSEAGVPPGPLTLKAGGELWVDAVRIGRFLIADTPEHALHPAGPGVYRAEGVPLADLPASTVRQGYIEGSNVNALDEMVGLVEAMRHAEAAQRLMRAYDEAMETALTTLGEF